MADIYVDTGSGNVAISQIDIDDIVRLNTNTISNVTTGGAQLLYFTTRTVSKAIIYAKDNSTGRIHTLEILTTLDGTTPYHVVYGEIETGSKIINITVDYGLVSGTNYLRVYATPVNTNSTTLRVFVTALT
jgi:hypothetical protein